MPPPMQQRFGAPNNLASHYNQYPLQAHSQSGLPPPGGSNPGFMNTNSMNNPFAMNGNSLGMSGGFGPGNGLHMPGGTGLASQAAQMSFAGASVQQHGHNGMVDAGSRGGGRTRIREVWKDNLHQEMAILRQLVDKYPFIAMDTEFPGLVARPMGAFRGKSDYHYQCLRCNVDLLKIIQLGITLFSEDGESPPPTSQSLESGIDTGRRNGGMVQLPCTWQFNFKFSLTQDMYSEASIDALKHAGVDFIGLERDGIEPNHFAALLMDSGLVCDEEVRWISFHGGYDFGYLTKLLLCKPLPDDEPEFAMLMKKFFPSIYDIKYLMKYAVKQNTMGQLTPDAGSAEVLQKFEQKSGLESLAETLKVKRHGAAHQAGSDSLLTGKVFFKIRERIFNGEIPDEHLGKVWGLGFPEHSNPQHSTPQHYHQQLQENTTPNQNGHSYSNGTPSTPNNAHAGLASTPSHVNNGAGIVNPMTPGGGTFGNFQYR